VFEVTREGGTAVVHLAHGKANALDLELCEGLSALLSDLAVPGDPAAVLITARGPIFSAGVDLSRLLREDASYTRRFVPALRRTLNRCFFFPKPLAVALNGHAIAGGCLLTLAADRRVGARGSGTIGVPELRVGVPFPGIALEIVRFGAPAAFRALVLDGRNLSFADACAAGVLDEVVEPSDLLPRATELLADLTTIPPEVFALTKDAMRAPARELLAVHARANERRVQKLWMSETTRERVRSYVSRTFKRTS